MIKRTKIYALGILLTFTLLLSGCIFNSSSSSNATNNIQNPNPAGLTNYEGIKKEYFESLGNLTFPESFILPTELDLDQTIQYQIGYGDTLASNLWQYAWEKEWLDSYQTDPQRAQKAIVELEKAFDMGYLSKTRADDATRRFLRDYIDRAKLGDPSGFQEDIRANPMD